MSAAAEMPFGDGLRTRIQSHLAAFDRHGLAASDRRPAAVAVVLLADDAGRPCFLLTRRAATLRAHARQWALPGGRIDAGETVIHGARRELAEEVGLGLGEESVLGLLDDYETRSGFVITPVVMWGEAAIELIPAPSEVAAVYRVPLSALDAPDVPRFVSIPESDRPVIQIPILSSLIHAPTGAVLYQLREVVMHGRPTRVAHFEQPVWAWR